jgi:PAS domain S-box-containing protein
MLRLSIPFSRRYAPIVIYGASFATTWGLLWLEAQVDTVEVAIALALQVAVGVQLFRVGRWDRRPWVGIVGMPVYLMSVGLLRDGVGQTAGYSSLLLLPVFWAAVRSRRAELVVTLAGSAILLFAPLLLIGGAHYPISGWRTGALWIVVAAGLGIAVLAIVDQLRSSNQRHRLLADNSTDLVSRMLVDGTLTYVSSGSRAMLGYEPEELVGRNITEFLHPQDRYAQAACRARIDEAPDAILQEFRMRHHDGRWLWFETAIRAVRDVGGVVIERAGAQRRRAGPRPFQAGQRQPRPPDRRQRARRGRTTPGGRRAGRRADGANRRRGVRVAHARGHAGRPLRRGRARPRSDQDDSIRRCRNPDGVNRRVLQSAGANGRRAGRPS